MEKRKESMRYLILFRPLVLAMLFLMLATALPPQTIFGMLQPAAKTDRPDK
jgi:hypothetical protein